MLIVKTNAGLYRTDFQVLKRMKLTNFMNWFCDLGKYNITVSPQKQISTSVCGNVGTVCSKTNCWCGIDIEIPKAVNETTLRILESEIINANLSSLPLYESGDIIAVAESDKIIESTLLLDWAPTKRCNYDCSYCPPRVHDNHSPLPDLDELKQIATDIIIPHKHKRIQINISGGEPTLWPDLLQFVQHLDSITERKRIRILTNGTASIQRLIELQQYSVLLISLHHEYVSDKLLNKFLDFLNETPHNKRVVFKMFQGHNFDDFVAQASKHDFVRISDNVPIVDKETNEWT